MRWPARPPRSRLILAAPLGAALLLLGSVSLAVAQGVGLYITTYPGGARPTCASITAPVVGKTYCYDAAEVVGGNPQNALKVWSGLTYVVVGGGGGSGSPAGPFGAVQFNASGVFGGEAGFEYDAGANRLTVANLTLSGVGALGTPAMFGTGGAFAAGGSYRDVSTYPDWGGTGAQNRAAIASAISDAPAGAIIQLPAGTFALDATPITVAKQICLVGQGVDNTILQTTATTTDVFDVTVSAPTCWRGFTIQHTGTTTAGASIHINPSANFGGLRIKDVRILGAWRAVHFEHGSEWVIETSRFENHRKTAVYIANPTSPDYGENTLLANVFTATGSTPDNHIEFHSGGGLRVLGNKFLQSDIAVALSPDSGVNTSVLQFVGNSCENFFTHCLQYQDSAGTYAYSSIVGNEFGLADGSRSGIAIGTSGLQIAIVANTLHFFSSAAGPRSGVVTTNGALDVHVSANVFQSDGGGGETRGVEINGTSTTSVGPNKFGAAISFPVVGTPITSDSSGLSLRANQDALRLLPFGTSAGNTSEIRLFELAANGIQYAGLKASDSIATSYVSVIPAAPCANGEAWVSNGGNPQIFACTPVGGGGAGTITSIGGQGGPVITLNGTPHANLSIAAAGNDLSIAQAGAFGAALGGTGQTSYTKGDLLVASAATTLTKLAVGANGLFLVADSTETAGVKWAAAPGGGTVTNTGALTAEAFILGNAGADVKAQAISGYVKGAGASAPSGVATIPAADGGTGQTSYTKGDLLVASASTTLAKLPIGADGQTLLADASQSTGVRWATLAGTGTVTSVGLAAPGGGVFSVTGSPVTAAGTLTLVATGTSGGIPYFASTSTIASSAALTNRGLLVGGGTGAAPRAIAAMANGQFPIGSTGADPVPGTLGSSTLTIAQGAGTLTADIPSPLKIAMQDKGGEQFDIAAYGAVPNSSGAAAANTAAWNAAKTAAAAAGGGIIYVPQGRWYLNVVADIPTNVSIRCSGQSTQLEFVPTADNQTFLHFNTAKDSGIRDCVIFSEELTFTKTAIKITNNDNFYADGVTIGYQGNNWTGAGSIGWDIGGHFLVKITRPDTYADRPLVFRGVAAAGYGCDFCYIGHGQLDANNSAHPTIEVLDTAVLSQTVIEDMSLHRASGWFTHIGPTNLSGGGPGALVFRDIRAEQPVDENDWCFNIDVPSPLHGLQIQFENVRCPNKNGIRLRRVEEVTLNGFFQSTASGTYTTSIDASAAGAFTGDIVIVNLITGATPVMTGYRLDFDALRGFQLWRSATATTAPTAQFSSVSTSGCVLGNGFFSCGAGGAVPAGPSKLAFSQPTSTIGVIAVHGPDTGTLGVMQFTLLNSADSAQLNPLVLSTNGARISLNTSSPLPTPAGVLQVAAITGAQTGIVAEAFGSQGAFIGRRASGSPTARGPLLANEPMVALIGQGAYDATNYSSSQASYGCFAAENWMASARGTFCTAGVTPLGSTVLSESMRWAGISGGQGFRVSLSPTNTGPSYDNSRPFSIVATTSGTRVASGGPGFFVENNNINALYLECNDTSQSASIQLGDRTSVCAMVHAKELTGFTGTAYGTTLLYTATASPGVGAERGAALMAMFVNAGGGNIGAYAANSFLGVDAAATSLPLGIIDLSEMNCRHADCAANAFGKAIQNITSALGTTTPAAAGLIIIPTTTTPGTTDAFGQAIRYGNYNGTDTRFQVTGTGVIANNLPAGTTGNLMLLQVNGGSMFQVDDTTSATASTVVITINGAQRRVEVQGVDTCGAGYRCLRVLN